MTLLFHASKLVNWRGHKLYEARSYLMPDLLLTSWRPVIWNWVSNRYIIGIRWFQIGHQQNCLIFLTPSLYTIGTDLYYKYTTSAFPWPPSPYNANIISGIPLKLWHSYFVRVLLWTSWQFLDWNWVSKLCIFISVTVWYLISILI